MVRMVCGQCKYSRDMTDFEAEVGMICPRCHCQKLRRPIKSRPEHTDYSLRTRTIQTLVGALGASILGPVLIFLGFHGAKDPSWPTERFVAVGAAFLVFGVIGMGFAAYHVYRDLTEE